MSRPYIVKRLPADRVDQAFPLVQSACGELALETWRGYAAIRSAPGGVIPDGGGGVVSVEGARSYIHGLFDYRIDIDLRCGRTLVCDNIVALDLLDAKSVLAVLFEAMESLAAQNRCQAVHVSVPEGGTALLCRLEDSGHAVRSVGLCKRLAGDDR